MYPASRMPEATIRSAISRTIRSPTSQPNRFHEFQPIGGVGARPADTGRADGEATATTADATNPATAARTTDRRTTPPTKTM
ncbi:MAG: hypothetical protein HOV94_15860 [Saccharothrix sp.]|nr:hypothetical protein [Saccharothrix sp.]